MSTQDNTPWIKKGNLQKASRIDYALTSGGLDQRVETIQYISSVQTDHRAIYMVVNLSPFERGRGYWKFNTQLLQDPKYLDFMNDEIQKCIASTISMNPKQRWETLKTRNKKNNNQILKGENIRRKTCPGSVV